MPMPPMSLHDTQMPPLSHASTGFPPSHNQQWSVQGQLSNPPRNQEQKTYSSRPPNLFLEGPGKPQSRVVMYQPAPRQTVEMPQRTGLIGVRWAPSPQTPQTWGAQTRGIWTNHSLTQGSLPPHQLHPAHQPHQPRHSHQYQPRQAHRLQQPRQPRQRQVFHPQPPPVYMPPRATAQVHGSVFPSSMPNRERAGRLGVGTETVFQAGSAEEPYCRLPFIPSSSAPPPAFVGDGTRAWRSGQATPHVREAPYSLHYRERTVRHRRPLSAVLGAPPVSFRAERLPQMTIDAATRAHTDRSAEKERRS
mmetsp:Transcript_27109/g.50592  ORF Transcript_27109/g.50592 Transcript_27109/m.50592 type:complete len:305 (+) Transcript_27109:1-915(+)